MYTPCGSSKMSLREYPKIELIYNYFLINYIRKKIMIFEQYCYVRFEVILSKSQKRK